MPSYFPTPYPDELWYSVLCRYHVRSGNPASVSTLWELFGVRKMDMLFHLLPNRSLQQVIDKLPDGLLDFDTAALNHTLFKYAVRLQTLETKKKLLEAARTGVIFHSFARRSGLNFCPVCRKEDFERYGEAYWHVSHQIPQATVCHKHERRLRTQRIAENRRSNCLVPLSAELDEGSGIDQEVSRAEIELTRTLTTYLELPLEAGPSQESSRLYEGLLKAGYGTANPPKQLAEDLYAKFGREQVREVFRSANLRRDVMERIRYWKYKTPERYALLALLIGQAAEVTFDTVRTEKA